MNPPLEYSQIFKSTLDDVIIQVASIILHLDQEIGEYNRFALDLVLREVLNNAVIHGNKADSEKSISLKLKAEAGQFRIVVEDEGDGFDWQSTIYGDADPQDDHGRGFPIFHSYCNEVELNEKGNRVSLTLDIKKSKS